jgi:DDE superfamily endonuclease
MGRTWAPRGCTPTIRHNSSWDKLSSIAGITLDGSIHFRVYDDSIKSEQIIEYLEQLLRYIPNHVVLLWGWFEDAHLERDQGVPGTAR